MSRHELAQLNIAQLRWPLDSPQLADFVANLDRINALAEGSPGFRWRLQTDEGDATAIRYFGEDVVVILSVWKDLPSLQAFAFRSDHREILRRRREWFVPMEKAYAVLWWIPAGHRPTLAEADACLEQLREAGPTDQAFSFRHSFPPPEEEAGGRPPKVSQAGSTPP